MSACGLQAASSRACVCVGGGGVRIVSGPRASDDELGALGRDDRKR